MANYNQYSLELEDVIRLMRFQAKQGLGNESSAYGIAGSFPHYKHFMMPPDQKEKLLAMHRASRANAGIYVAVVLGVYLILLTLLLCRYAKRHRPSTETAGLLTVPPPIPPPSTRRSGGRCSRLFCCCGGGCKFRCLLTPTRVIAFYKRMCCRQTSTNNNMEESIHEIADLPMTSLNSHVEMKGRVNGKNKPVPV